MSEPQPPAEEVRGHRQCPRGGPVHRRRIRQGPPHKGACEEVCGEAGAASIPKGPPAPALRGERGPDRAAFSHRPSRGR